jgi:Glycosyltransferase sugar-binding region containing DXD motif
MIIHRFWSGPLLKDHWITATVQKAHRKFEIKDWTLDTLPNELRILLNVPDDPRHLSNIIRYWLLHKYGGLWLDHDVIPLRDLTGEVKPWTASLRGHREGSVMWFPKPLHPMMSEMFNSGLKAPVASSPIRSGSILLHRVGLNYPDVGYESRVLPIDALGQQTGETGVWALHLWNTSTRNLVQ